MSSFTDSFDNLANVIDKLTEAVGVSRHALYVQVAVHGRRAMSSASFPTRE